MNQSWRIVGRSVGRFVTAAFFVIAGSYHFVNPGFYIRIVPPGFGDPALLVAISGVCEIAGGLGLLIPPLRPAAMWGLIALLVAVFPANLYMAIYPDRIAGLHVARWVLWGRLPLQPMLMAWIWYVASRQKAEKGAIEQ